MKENIKKALNKIKGISLIIPVILLSSCGDGYSDGVRTGKVLDVSLHRGQLGDDSYEISINVPLESGDWRLSENDVLTNLKSELSESQQEKKIQNSALYARDIFKVSVKKENFVKKQEQIKTAISCLQTGKLCEITYKQDALPNLLEVSSRYELIGVKKLNY